MCRFLASRLVVAVLLLSAASAPAARTVCSLAVEVFDANVAYTPGVALPLASSGPAALTPLTTATFDAGARRVTRVAADGVTLLLVRATFPAGAPSGAVTFRLDSVEPGASPGALFPVDEQRVADTSALGGAIDTPGLVGPSTLSTKAVTIGGKGYAFALYRAPRDFDGGPPTSSLASRGVALDVSAGSCDDKEALTAVRPLVVFIHGTVVDNDSWIDFPLWKDSGNELEGFGHGHLPYDATRISYRWIWNAGGGVEENAATILPQLVTAIRGWREETQTAATQADVVTHSFGGFVARQVVQTQADASPLGTRPWRSYRAAANLGHGSMHKLVTLAATHRGAASADATAFVNANGSVPGFLRNGACLTGSYIDKGAVRDQMVFSDALRALAQTRVPGHAIAGSARAALDPTGTFGLEFAAIALLDSSGPYGKAYAMTCGVDRMTNYIFNLDTESPKVQGSGTQCSVTPEYDLVVSERSSRGLMPNGAWTSGADLDAVGTLNHTAFHSPAYGSAALVDRVSDRVRFLLEQRTTSPFFSAFPAHSSGAPTDAETRFMNEFQPAWLLQGTCPSRVIDPTCPAYSDVKVVPAALRLEDTLPTPLEVYGLLSGQWVLAYSPKSSGSSRACTVTLTSSDTSVAEIQTDAATGAQTVVAKAIGHASITVNVKNAGDRVVPVEVVALGN